MIQRTGFPVTVEKHLFAPRVTYLAPLPGERGRRSVSHTSVLAPLPELDLTGKVTGDTRRLVRGGAQDEGDRALGYVSGTAMAGSASASVPTLVHFEKRFKSVLGIHVVVYFRRG